MSERKFRAFFRQLIPNPDPQGQEQFVWIGTSTREISVESDTRSSEAGVFGEACAIAERQARAESAAVSAAGQIGHTVVDHLEFLGDRKLAMAAH